MHWILILPIPHSEILIQMGLFDLLDPQQASRLGHLLN